jgi:hypothetical protein
MSGAPCSRRYSPLRINGLFRVGATLRVRFCSPSLSEVEGSEVEGWSPVVAKRESVEQTFLSVLLEIPVCSLIVKPEYLTHLSIKCLTRLHK